MRSASLAYRIVIADDHVLLRQGLKKLVEERSGYRVVGEAGDGIELLRMLNEVSPDLVVLDLSMPRLRGVEAARDIKSLHPGVKVLVLTMHKEKEYLYHTISAGVDGYLLKEDADTELFAAAEAVRNGRFYLSPILRSEMTEDWVNICRGKFEPPAEVLSNREKQILKLIAEGKSSKDIAGLLFISVRTVEHHRANIMSKLKVKKMADLVKYAIQKGYA